MSACPSASWEHRGNRQGKDVPETQPTPPQTPAGSTATGQPPPASAREPSSENTHTALFVDQETSNARSSGAQRPTQPSPEAQSPGTRSGDQRQSEACEGSHLITARHSRGVGAGLVGTGAIHVQRNLLPLAATVVGVQGVDGHLKLYLQTPSTPSHEDPEGIPTPPRPLPNPFLAQKQGSNSIRNVNGFFAGRKWLASACLVTSVFPLHSRRSKLGANILKCQEISPKILHLQLLLQVPRTGNPKHYCSVAMTGWGHV